MPTVDRSSHKKLQCAAARMPGESPVGVRVPTWRRDGYGRDCRVEATSPAGPAGNVCGTLRIFTPETDAVAAPAAIVHQRGPTPRRPAQAKLQGCFRRRHVALRSLALFEHCA
eukprot:356721-Chlamydomonas_euryale.AAC.4